MSERPSNKPVLQPPGKPLPTATGLIPDKPVRKRWLWIALAVSGALMVFVVFALPSWVTTQTGPGHQPLSQAALAEPSTLTNGGTDAADANRAVQEYLRRVAALTLINANNWGDPRWQQATTLANKADRLFGERRFRAAANDYTAAMTTLKALQDDREALLNAAINRGQTALAENDITKALAQFERALAIDADSDAAQKALATAAVRTEVLDFMASGKQAEQASDLDAAQAAYRAAIALDSDYTLAAQRLQSVTAQITQAHFRQLMSKALTALDNNQLSEARQALTKAGRLKPGDPALRDAQQRLALVSQQGALDALRVQAAALTKKEDWRAAIDVYKKALSIEANAAFAKSGLAHAQKQLTINSQFDHYLNAPARLYSSEPLAHAQKLMAATTADAASEPGLFAKRTLLQSLITEAMTPLPLTLHSDASTDVAIYHVGKFGRFKDRQLNLKPGTYTIVGARTGYRDVRQVVTLLPGQPAPVVDVRCEEPI